VVTTLEEISVVAISTIIILQNAMQPGT